MKSRDEPEAFGYYTEVSSIEPTYKTPPAYAGGNARQKLDDVQKGAEVALKRFVISIRLKSNDRDANDYNFEVSYRVDYEDREVVVSSITQKYRRSSDNDDTVKAFSSAAAVARADRAAKEFLKREGVGFDFRSFASLIRDAREEAGDVLVSDVETVVEAQERVDG